jgi:hypothetical protein
MAAENQVTRGVKIIIGQKDGACSLVGVTISGSEIPGCKKVISEEDKKFFKEHERLCKKRNGGVGGCCLCTADPTNPESVSRFCPFSDGLNQR